MSHFGSRHYDVKPAYSWIRPQTAAVPLAQLTPIALTLPPHAVGGKGGPRTAP